MLLYVINIYTPDVEHSSAPKKNSPPPLAVSPSLSSPLFNQALEKALILELCLELEINLVNLVALRTRDVVEIHSQRIGQLGLEVFAEDIVVQASAHLP